MRQARELEAFQLLSPGETPTSNENSFELEIGLFSDVISNLIVSLLFPRREGFIWLSIGPCLISFFTAFRHVRRHFSATAETGKPNLKCLDVLFDQVVNVHVGLYL